MGDELRAQSAMKRFYNVFPYPGRPLFVMPKRIMMGLSHMGFARLLANNELGAARSFWKVFHASQHRSFAATGPKRGALQSLDAILSHGYGKTAPRILLAGCGTDEPVLYMSLHPSARIDAVCNLLHLSEVIFIRSFVELAQTSFS